LGELALCLVAAGRREQARAILPRLTDPFDVALLETALGNRGAALAALRRAIEERDFRVAHLVGRGDFAEDFQSLEGDPEFEALVAPIGKPK
jgi:hypothetical protein